MRLTVRLIRSIVTEQKVTQDPSLPGHLARKDSDGLLRPVDVAHKS